MRTVIIDDDPKVRQGLVELTRIFCPGLELVGEANGVASGREVIENCQPEVVLLDVEMGDGTGMDLLASLEQVSFHVVFVTAHNRYAVQAFEFSALDFLLKPVDPEDLIRAINRARDRIYQETLLIRLKALSANLNQGDERSQKLVLRDSENLHIVEINEVICLEAQGSYTRFYLTNDRKLLVSKNLREYEKMLSSHDFFRAHHSFLIRLGHLKRYERRDGGMAILAGDLRVPVSYRRKDRLLKRIENL